MAVGFLVIKNCCFYLPLATGTKFFGFLSLSGSILLLLFGCVDLAHIAYFSRDPEFKEHYLKEEIMLTGADITVQIIQTCTAMLLLLGVYQQKAKLITYWLFTTPIVAFLETTILSNITFHLFYVRHYKLDWFILNAITLIDDIYGWIVAYSYYHSILTPEANAV